MLNRIEVDRSGYHLKSAQPAVRKQNEPFKTSEATVAPKPITKETLQSIDQNVKLATRANYQKLGVQNTKTPEQVIDTYASYRKMKQEAHIKTRFDLLI